MAFSALFKQGLAGEVRTQMQQENVEGTQNGKQTSQDLSKPPGRFELPNSATLARTHYDFEAPFACAGSEDIGASQLLARTS